MLALLSVFVGGGLGAALRYCVGLWTMARWTYPFGTLLVNLVGSLLIGVFFALSVRYAWSAELKALLIAGLLGGLTTFSSFSLESIRLLQEQRYVEAAVHFALNNILGLALAAIGWWLTSRLLA